MGGSEAGALYSVSCPDAFPPRRPGLVRAGISFPGSAQLLVRPTGALKQRRNCSRPGAADLFRRTTGDGCRLAWEGG